MTAGHAAMINPALAKVIIYEKYFFLLLIDQGLHQSKTIERGGLNNCMSPPGGLSADFQLGF